MIRSVIRTYFDHVMAFNGSGRQMPKYQGKYQDVKNAVLKDASAETDFLHEISNGNLESISRENW